MPASDRDDVARAAATNDAPRRVAGHLEQAVVVEEPREHARRKRRDLRERRGPDRRDHGVEKAATELLREPFLHQPRVQGQFTSLLRIVEQTAGAPVEPEDLGQQAVVRRPDQVSAVGEEAVQPPAAVLES
jgi:hypothetical protein